MQIHADKRAAILKFDIGKTADRKRAIFRRIPARRVFTWIYCVLLSAAVVMAELMTAALQ